MAEQYVFSTIGGRLFACDAGKAGASGTEYTELTGLTKTPGIKFNRNIKEYDIANNGGWKVKSFLGQSINDQSMSFVRMEKDGTYKYAKDWTKESVGTSKALRDLVFMVPNDDNTYDVSVITCGVKESSLVAIDPTIGQEFDLTVSATGMLKYFNGTLTDEQPVLTVVA